MMSANKSGIGMVFQEQSLINNRPLPRTSIWAVSSFKRTSHSVVKNECGRKKVLIWGRYFRKSKVRDLSFAMRQMVEIAKCLTST